MPKPVRSAVFPVPKDVPCQTNPRSGLDARVVHHFFVIFDHPLEWCSSGAGKCADLHGGQSLAVHGITAYARTVHECWLNQRWLERGVVDGRIKGRQRIALAEARLDEIEPGTEIKGESFRYLPRILDVPLNIVVPPVRTRMAVRFRVGVNDPKHCIRVSITSVEGVRSVSVKRE